MKEKQREKEGGCEGVEKEKSRDYGGGFDDQPGFGNPCVPSGVDSSLHASIMNERSCSAEDQAYQAY